MLKLLLNNLSGKVEANGAVRLRIHETWCSLNRNKKRNHKLNSFAVKLAAVSVADTVRTPEYSSEV